MGYFYNKFLESAAVQTDDEIGNDLKQIEDDIEGKDGIEAHAEEIEDALDGMVGDPFDETAVLTEGFSYSKKPDKKFYTLAEKVFKDLIKNVGELRQYNNNLTDAGGKMNADMWFKLSTKRIDKKISQAKAKSKASIYVPISITDIDIIAEKGKMLTAVENVIKSNGFTYMKKSKNVLKDFFQIKYCFKELSNDDVAILYIEYANAAQLGRYLKVSIKCIKNDEKNLKKLNIVESVSNVIDMIKDLQSV